MRRVGGRHLYLSALPDGLVTTIYATTRPTRWEIFSVIDFQVSASWQAGLHLQLACI